MEKRALLAIALSVAVMAVWQVWFAPPVPVPPDSQVPAASTPSIDPAGEAAPSRVETADVPAAGSSEGIPAESEEVASAERVEASAEEEFRTRTENHDLRLSNKGGRILWWRLPAYTKNEDIPVDVIPAYATRFDAFPLQVEVPGDPELTRRLAEALHVHRVEEVRDPEVGGAAGPGQRVSFSWSDGQGIEVEKSVWVPERGYITRFQVHVTRHGRPLDATLVVASGLGGDEGNGDQSTRQIWNVEGRAVWLVGGGIERTKASDFEGPVLPGPVEWAGLESTYFAAIALPDDASRSGAPRVVYEPRQATGVTDEEHHLVTASIRLADGRADQRVFVGPKDYGMLASLGHELDLVIDFSSFPLIHAITKYLFLGLVWINSYVGNYGWSIIIMTFLVRFAFFPITYRSMITMRKTSKKMAKVQPKVKSIQERYRKLKKSVETQQKMNQEIMALYKKEGVNPMASVGGCLPLLLQMPIFIAFYNLLSVTIEVRQAPFIGWIEDLSQRDPYYITPILMGASWILQQAMTSSAIPDPMQRRMMMIMPVIFTFMMMNMPSGLVLYWLTSNILGMAQQQLINRKADAQTATPARAPEGERKARRAEEAAGSAAVEAGKEPETRRADNG